MCGYLELQENSFSGFLNWILNLRKELDIPHKLSEVVQVKNEDIEKLSMMALEAPSTAGNPKKLQLNDLKILYQYSIQGKLFD